MRKIVTILKGIVLIELFIVIVGMSAGIYITGIYSDVSVILSTLISTGLIWIAAGALAFILAVTLFLTSLRKSSYIEDIIIVFLLLAAIITACIGIIVFIMSKGVTINV